MSHEQIRQKVLQVQPIGRKKNRTGRQEIDFLFLEVDDLHISLQQADKDRHEIKAGVAHEGWKKKKRHPKRKEYTLINKSYWHTLKGGTAFWDTFSRSLCDKYMITVLLTWMGTVDPGMDSLLPLCHLYVQPLPP